MPRGTLFPRPEAIAAGIIRFLTGGARRRNQDPAELQVSVHAKLLPADSPSSELAREYGAQSIPKDSGARRGEARLPLRRSSASTGRRLPGRSVPAAIRDADGKAL